MEENNTQNSQYQITDVLPKYAKIDQIYQQILKTHILTFDEQYQLSNFYNQFKNLENFANAVLDFITSKEKEKQLQFFRYCEK